MKSRRSRAALVALIAIAACARADRWERRPIGGTSFTTEFPIGPDVDMPAPNTWKNEKSGGGERSQFVELLPRPSTPDTLDRIAAGSSDRFREGSMTSFFTRTWGEPKFEPPTRTKVGDYAAVEAGWRFPYGDRMKIQLLYEVEIGPNRFVFIDLNCYEGAFKKLAPLYERMKNSLQPPGPKA